MEVLPRANADFCARAIGRPVNIPLVGESIRLKTLLDLKHCPLCFGKAAFVPTTHSAPPADLGIACKCCGHFDVGPSLVHMPEIPLELRSHLSAATRQACEAGRVLLLHRKNLEEVAAPHRAVTISQKVENLLRYAALKCKHPGGGVVRIDAFLDYPVADCNDANELMHYLRYLENKGLLQGVTDDSGASTDDYAPTIDGWQAVEPTLSPGGTPGRCFVAMSFADSLEHAYSQGIKPAIQVDCGFQCVCLRDEVPKPSGITDRILSEVRLAQFVVADFTGQNHGVYFEAGFARGLGRDVIWTCHADEVKSLHFDTKHLGHVVWRDPADLRRRLADSIRANIVTPNR